MKQSRRNKLIAAAAAAAAGQIISNNNKLTTTILRIAVIDEIDKEVKRKKPRLRRKGSLHTPGQSLWRKIDDDGEELEFLFLLPTRDSLSIYWSNYILHNSTIILLLPVLVHHRIFFIKTDLYKP